MGVEWFAGGVGVGLAGWWRWWWSVRRVGFGDAGDQASVSVVELQVAGDVGVASHGELAAVVGVVIAGTKRAEIPGVSRAAEDPVQQVVDFEVGGGVASGAQAATIAIQDDPPGA